VGRRRGNGHARLSDLQPSNSVMDGQARRWPQLYDFPIDRGEGTPGEWTIGFVFEKPHLPAAVSPSDDPEECGQRTASFTIAPDFSLEGERQPLG